MYQEICRDSAHVTVQRRSNAMLPAVPWRCPARSLSQQTMADNSPAQGVTPGLSTPFGAGSSCLVQCG